MASAARWLPPVDKRAALIFAVALALLLAPWPLLGRAFGALFSAYANGVTRVLGLGGEATPRFSLPPGGEAPAEDGGAWAVQLTARGADGAAPESAPVFLDTRVLGYTPVAVLLALAAASRLPRRRRLEVFAFALACLLARTAAAIALPVARTFEGARAAWAFGPFAELLWFGLIMPPVMSYATPLLAWWTGFALTTPPDAPATKRGDRRARGRGGQREQREQRD
jgi:hypothetical protein